jgi:aspartate/methionine/tyrosine aminotransferase
MADNFAFAHQHRREIAWMSQNTNTIPLPPVIRDAMVRAIDEGEHHLYPLKGGIAGLPEAIREDLGLPDYDVIVTNGGLEGTYMATRALLHRGDEVLATDPSFLPIHDQIALCDAPIREVAIYREPWRLTPEAMQAALTPAMRLFFLVDPHNPLGFAYTRPEKKALCDVAADAGLTILDDATYRDFNPDHLLASDFYPDRTIVSCTFSKGPGLAGMRVGAILGPKAVMKEVRRFTVNVLGANVLGQRAALAALEHKREWLPVVRETTAGNQEVIRAAAGKVDGCFLPVYPSKANLFCIDVGATGINPDAIEERLLFDHKVHIRSGTYLSKTVGSRFVRVSFSVPRKDAERFAHAFPPAMERLRGA